MRVRVRACVHMCVLMYVCVLAVCNKAQTWVRVCVCVPVRACVRMLELISANLMLFQIYINTNIDYYPSKSIFIFLLICCCWVFFIKCLAIGPIGECNISKAIFCVKF